MKMLLARLCVAAFFVVMVPAFVSAQSRSVSSDPGFVPPSLGAPILGLQPGTLTNDGSFENGPPPASAWTEVTSSLCGSMILDPTPFWALPAYNGIYAYWAGGYCDLIPTSGYVEQSISVPQHAVTLRFQTIFWRPDPNDPPNTDVFTVSIDGTPVFTRDMVQANDTFPNWVERAVDITAYAGQFVTLRIEGQSAGDRTGNVLVDYMTIEVAAAVPTLNQWGLIIWVTLGGLAGVYYFRRKKRSAFGYSSQ